MISRSDKIITLLNQDLNDALIELLKTETRVRKLEGMIELLLEYVDNESDVVDGPHGPEANAALALASSIRAELDWGGIISIKDLE